MDVGGDTSVVELIAEIAVGLIGFAGVVSVLARSRLPPAVRSFRIRALLANGSLALVGALVPIVLSGYQLTEESRWTAAACLFLFLQGSVIVWAGRELKALLGAGQIPQKMTYLVLGLATAALIYLVSGVVFLREALPAIYVVVLFVSILLSLYHFVWLVLSIQAAED
jgi:uncharacterized membrane protein YuzA (DUF378 family)